MVNGIEFLRMVFHPQANELTLRSILTPSVEVAQPRPAHPIQTTMDQIMKMDEIACQWIEDVESSSYGRSESVNAPSPDDLPLSPWDNSTLPVSRRAPCPSGRTVGIHTEPSPPGLACILQGLPIPFPAHSDSRVPWFLNPPSESLNPLDSIQAHKRDYFNTLNVVIDDAHGLSPNPHRKMTPTPSERLSLGRSCRLASLLPIPSSCLNELGSAPGQTTQSISSMPRMPTPTPSLKDLENIMSDSPSGNEEEWRSCKEIGEHSAMSVTWADSQAYHTSTCEELKSPEYQYSRSLEVDNTSVSGHTSHTSHILAYPNTPESPTGSLLYVESPASAESFQPANASPSPTRFYLELLEVESSAKKNEVQDWMYSLLAPDYFAAEDALFRSYGIDIEWE